MGSIQRAVGLILAVAVSLCSCVSTHYLSPAETREFLTRRTIHLVLEDGTKFDLHRCTLDENRLIGYTRSNLRVEVELSRIRASYYRKLKPSVPLLGAFSAGSVAIAVWIIAGAFTAPEQAP